MPQCTGDNVGDQGDLVGSRISGGTSGWRGLPMIDKAGYIAWAAEAVAVFQKHCGSGDEHADRRRFIA
jgi:hypothetical protein